jgi:hypothetical protein
MWSHGLAQKTYTVVYKYKCTRSMPIVLDKFTRSTPLVFCPLPKETAFYE